MSKLGDTEYIAKHASSLVANGGCICVMLNTVHQAQQVYTELIKLVPDDVNTLLFHARYQVKNRKAVEENCIKWFGKGADSSRPTKAILVCTQVVEQSLDVDFDYMITEIAPIDLLLQRAGRVHRHRNNMRPSGMKSPTIEVLIPGSNSSSDARRRYGTTGVIYDPFLLTNTETLLSSLDVIRIPEDMRHAIEKCYENIDEKNMAEYIRLQAGNSFLKSEAESVIYSKPNPKLFFPVQSHKKNSVKVATYSRLQQSLTVLRSYAIANIDIADIYPSDIQVYINQLAESDYSLSSIKKQIFIVTAPLKHAAALRHIPVDPTIGIKRPNEQSLQRIQHDVNAYDRDEQTRLRSALKRYPNTCGLVIEFILETGLRIGECLALTWDDIDWNKKAIKVHKTLVQPTSRRKRYVQNSAKTRSSNRIIPASRRCYEILTLLQLRSCSEFIFVNVNNRIISYQSLRKYTNKVCTAANVPYKGIHVFRHTFATNCYYRGCDVKILSRLLGHASTAITYQSYINLFDDGLEDMRAILE